MTNTLRFMFNSPVMERKRGGEEEKNGRDSIIMKDNSSRYLMIRNVLSQHLALRDNADYLFGIIEREPSQVVTVDFSGIRSISRSFAHQYLIRKKKVSSKKVHEANVPESVQKLFDIINETSVRDSSSRSSSSSNSMSILKELDSMEIVTL